MNSLVKNAADPEQVREGKAAKRWERETELRDLKAVLETVEGRRVMWRLLTQTGVYDTPWVDRDSSRIAFNIGRQDVGRFLLSEIAAADEMLYFKMQLEAKERKEKERSNG